MNLPKNEFRMSITSGCNMKCVYCHNEGNNKPAILSIEDIEKIINAAQNLGIVKMLNNKVNYHIEEKLRVEQ